MRRFRRTNITMKISDFREKSIRFDTTQHTTKKQFDEEKSLTHSFFFCEKAEQKARNLNFAQPAFRKRKRGNKTSSSRCWFYDNQHPFPFLVRHQNHIK